MLNYCKNNSLCQNGGLCIDDLNNLYTCKCQPGFYGKNCEHVINSCDLLPCQNDGKCYTVR